MREHCYTVLSSCNVAGASEPPGLASEQEDLTEIKTKRLQHRLKAGIYYVLLRQVVFDSLDYILQFGDVKC